VLLNHGGQAGLIATNTIAQGDTREVGLDQIVASGATIRQAVKSAPWPSRSVVLEYSAMWTSRAQIEAEAKRLADGLSVPGITTSLDPASRVSGIPNSLIANAGMAFIGSYILGMGFTMRKERAQQLIREDPRNAEVLFPYLNGEDLNSNYSCSGNRWVINFHDWPEEKARTYHECYEQVLRDVKPERERNPNKQRRELWWRFTRPVPELYRAISDLDRVIVLARVSKAVMPVLVPVGSVFTIDLAVFASDDTALLALLSSTLHYSWTIDRASTLETRIRYTLSDVFETFPLPDLTPEMRSLGDRLDRFRRELMLARRAGLTKMYNLVHDSRCTDSDIVELREIHRQIDQAVAHSYGWDDLDLDPGFHETRQGIRYTIGPVVRQEILDRLLELNHERYAAEVAAGLHKTSKKARGAETRLF
jgi:hypothetical protein